MPERGVAREAHDARRARAEGGPDGCFSRVAPGVALGADLVELPGGAFVMGTDGTDGYADDGRPGPRSPSRADLDRALRGHKRRVRGLRRGDGASHRGGGVRVVVRVRRPVARRPPDAG